MSVNILLVDNVASYRGAVALALKRLGFNSVETDSGEAALDILRKDTFHVVLLDNELAGMRGLDLVPAIRDIDKQVQLVLVVEPSFSEPDDNDFTARNGLSRLVHGPLSPEALADQVENLLSGDQPAPPRPSEPPVSIQTSERTPELDIKTRGHLMDVRRSYQEKLPAKLLELEQVLEKARECPGDRELLHEAHRLAHTLHGTSGTLGFPEISSATGKIDEKLKTMLSGGFSDDTVWDDIFEMLERAATAPERMSLVITTEPRSANFATVLMLDDNSALTEKLVEVAHSHLIDIIMATSREEALAHAYTGSLDGAIIDINFGGDSDAAIGMIYELRSIKGLRELPVAMMSDDSSVLNRVGAAHAGASHFLKKPFTGDELVEVVRYFTSVDTSVSYRVMVVDDDEHFRQHVAAILRGEGMKVITLDKPEQTLETAESAKPDLMMLDVMMPKVSGFDVCRMMRSTTNWKDIPVLFLTAESSPEVRLECFQAGGDDYIEKPVIKEELLARIGVRLERVRLFRERADKDMLTGLLNRRAFLEMFRVRVAEGQRYDRPVSLCLIDIDKFKFVNDTYGHLAGDRVLAALGKLLLARFRTVDIRGRWGGEEFAIVFYGEGSGTVKMIITRVLEEFRQMTFKGDYGEEFSCTFSGGIAAYPKEGESPDALFRVADEKLYAAKEAGRNCLMT